MTWTRLQPAATGTYPGWPSTDSTGANKLTAVVLYGGTTTGSLDSPDARGNAWTLRSSSDYVGYIVEIYDCLNPVSVGTGHVVQHTQGNVFTGLIFFTPWSADGAYEFFDEVALNDATFSATHVTTGPITTTEDGAFILAAAMLGSGTGAGWATSVGSVDASHAYGMSAYANQASAGSINPDLSWTNASRWVTAMVAYQPAAAPSGPTINTQPTAQTANEPATATFTVSATTSGGTLHYQWKRADPGSGTFSNVGTDSSSYTTGATSAASDHGASYKVDVTDDNGTTVSDTVVLTVRSTTTVARPSADVSATGWTASTGSDLFAMIDEASASDADYITSPTITGSTAPATFTLAYPLNTGSWTLSVRAKTSTGTATLRLYLLNDANTVVGTSGDQTITSSFTTYQLAVTSSGPATRARVEIVS